MALNSGSTIVILKSNGEVYKWRTTDEQAEMIAEVVKAGIALHDAANRDSSSPADKEVGSQG
jgi:hypothetical protein